MSSGEKCEKYKIQSLLPEDSEKRKVDINVSCKQFYNADGAYDEGFVSAVCYVETSSSRPIPVTVDIPHCIIIPLAVTASLFTFIQSEFPICCIKYVGGAVALCMMSTSPAIGGIQRLFICDANYVCTIFSCKCGPEKYLIRVYVTRNVEAHLKVRKRNTIVVLYNHPSESW